MSSCKYDDLIGIKEPFSVTDDWLDIWVENLDPDAFYVTRLFLWAPQERPMRIEIYHPKEVSPAFRGAFKLGPSLDSKGNGQWTSKRYKLNSERQNGCSLLRVGFNSSSVVAPTQPVEFRIYAKPLTSRKIREKKRIEKGRCPECGEQGHWQAMAMVCPTHGRFLG